MFTTPLQRLGFVIGLPWSCFVIFASLYEVLGTGIWTKLIGGVVIGVVPTLALWWITGTLKPVVAWFKGTQKG